MIGEALCVIMTSQGQIYIKNETYMQSNCLQ